MMKTALLILTLSMGAEEPARPASGANGLRGLFATSTSGRWTAESPRGRWTSRDSIERSQRSRAAGGGATNASQLIELIQTNVAPDSWQAPAGVGGFGGPFGPSPGGGSGAAMRRDQLIDLIQETVQPESWDVNGGPGSIGVYPH